MAVLEAVRGWDALKPADSTESVEGESESSEEVTEAAPELEESRWTEARINELKGTDPLSILLEHERHISGGADDEITKTCKHTKRRHTESGQITDQCGFSICSPPIHS